MEPQVQPIKYELLNEEEWLAQEIKKLEPLGIKTPKSADFKVLKKKTRSIANLCNLEKKNYNELVSVEPTQNMFVVHFGYGDEVDYKTLMPLLENFNPVKLNIFPGNPYGFIRFSSVDKATEFMKFISDQLKPDALVKNVITLKYETQERLTFFYYSKVQIELLNPNRLNELPNASYEVSVPGLVLLNDIITEQEEDSIIKEIDKNKWTKLANRKVQHYGYEFIYGLNSINPDKKIGDLPLFVQSIVAKLNDKFSAQNNGPFDQLTINNYYPGNGIPPHFDTHSPFEEAIVSVSIGSGVVMSFKKYDGIEKHLFLKPRSALCMTGELRYAWYHGIASRKLDVVEDTFFFRKRRISLTFRRIKRDLCKCTFPIFCDSQGYDPVKFKQEKKSFKGTDVKHKNVKEREIVEATPEESAMIENLSKDSTNKATQLEKSYVYDVYEKIAPHFSHTRYKPWPLVAKYLNSLEDYDIVADVGCGNGKYLGVNKKLWMIGTDRCENLIQICRERDNTFQVFSADSLKLPMRSNCVDHIISIAVIHHFSTPALRIAALKEMDRILKVGGTMLIYVWAFEQDERHFSQQDVFVPWNLHNKYENENEEEAKLETNSEVDDPTYKFVDENKKTVVYKRYYHLFKNGELNKLIDQLENYEIINSYYDQANWCLIIKKIKINQQVKKQKIKHNECYEEKQL